MLMAAAQYNKSLMVSSRKVFSRTPRMPPNKKGMIEVQFNWIFVMIAGFLIFLFIISIIMSQKKHADNMINTDLIKKVTTTIRSKQQLSNTYNEVEIPDVKMYFYCDNETKLSEFRFEGSQAREQLPQEILFTSATMNSDMMYIWTQDFSIPFTVNRFIYLTNPKQIFIIYNSSNVPIINSYAFEVYNTLPQNITKAYASSSTLANKIKGFESYKIICFNSDCPSSSYSFINITPSKEGVYTYGNVTFHYGKNNFNKRLAYISGAALFGAIFSDNPEYYDCQMKRALVQFEIKRIIQYNRMNLISQDITFENPACVPLLSRPLFTLRNMRGLKLNDSRIIYSEIINLERDNKDLGFRGCPQAY